jgi:hypothetical protein
MEEKPLAGFEGQLRQFVCPSCQSQLRQPLVIQPKPVVRAGQRSDSPHLECAECAFGDLNCANCDDPLCATHVRSIEKYANHLPPELGRAMLERYGGRLYCPLCIKTVIDRFSLELRHDQNVRPRLFNWPIVIGLLVVFALILLGLKSCDAAAVLERGKPVSSTTAAP